MLTAMFAQHTQDAPAIVFLGLSLLIGHGLGLINGSLIAFLGIPPIVVTLGTLAIFRGMIVVVGGGGQVNAPDMGENFQSFPKLTFLGLYQRVLDRRG